jgi:hypothetical protein
VLPLVGTEIDPSEAIGYTLIFTGPATYRKEFEGVTTIATGEYPNASGEFVTCVKVPVPIENPLTELAVAFATYTTLFPVVPPPPPPPVTGTKNPEQPVRAGINAALIITTRRCNFPTLPIIDNLLLLLSQHTLSLHQDKRSQPIYNSAKCHHQNSYAGSPLPS